MDREREFVLHIFLFSFFFIFLLFSAFSWRHQNISISSFRMVTKHCKLAEAAHDMSLIFPCNLLSFSSPFFKIFESFFSRAIYLYRIELKLLRLRRDNVRVEHLGPIMPFDLFF